VPILTLQQSWRELGRIRAGDRVGNRPRKLSTFRLTSKDKTAIEMAAAAYGGTVSRWKEAPEETGEQWQVTIDAKRLPVLVPPGQVMSQWMELWKGGGCLRRCDGITETLTGQSCLCPSEPKARTELAAKGEACKPTSRVAVMLPALRDIGVWRLETHSFYAATELGGMVAICQKATVAGYPIEAWAAIDMRSKKVPGQARRDYPVVMLGMDSTPAELVAIARTAGGEPAAIGPGPAAPMLTAGGRPDIPHAPEPRGLQAEANAAYQEAEAAFVAGEPVADALFAATVKADRPALAQRLLDLADELAGTVGTGPVTEEQKAAVQKLTLPMGLTVLGNVLARVWGIERDPETGKWNLAAPQAAAIIAAAADPDFEDRWRELGAAEPTSQIA
jgi:hypothetical protein